MKRFALLVCILSVCSCELVQVVTMFRHGARYHLNSVYDGASTRIDWGQLTAVGMNQHYTLGGMLRDHYSTKLGFIRPTFNSSEVEVYSTNIDRTINSAQSNLFGMFPNQTGQKIPIGLDEGLMVPPYHYNDTIKDNFALPNGHQMVPVGVKGPIYTCSNLSKEVAKNVADEHVSIDEMNTRYAPVLDRMRQIFNLSAPIELRNGSNLADTITVDRFLNRKLPAELTEEDYLNVLHLQNYMGFISTGRNVSRVVSTSKLSKILEVFDKRIAKPDWLLKLTVLSGHDTDVAPMLLSMNFSSHICIEELYRYGKTNALNCEPGPQYAANIIWQLHRNDTDRSSYYVQVRSNGRLMNLCERKQTECSYTEWKSRVSATLIDATELCPKPN